MLNLLQHFFMSLDNVDKLAKFYFENADMLANLKSRFPDWECYVNRYLSTEMQDQLREKGVPL